LNTKCRRVSIFEICMRRIIIKNAGFRQYLQVIGERSFKIET
jgi:hypothetical protein